MITATIDIYEVARTVQRTANSTECKLLDDTKSELMVAINSMYCGKGVRPLQHIMTAVCGSNMHKELLMKVADDPVKFYQACGGADCKRVLSIVGDQWNAWHRDLSVWHDLCTSPSIMKDCGLIGCMHCC